MLHFDHNAFAVHVRTKRGSASLRQVAQITGLSVPTLSRLENGHKPDTDTFLCLCVWMDIAPETFFRDVPTHREEVEILERIELALRADPVLNKDFIDALLHLIRLFHQHQKEKERA